MIHYCSDYLSNPPHPISVYLIGCGGTGSQVLSGLARINHAMQALEHPGLFVYVFDGDQVDETNIGRQLFSPSDIGRNKAEVLVSRVNHYFGQGWQSVSSHFSESLFKEMKGANLIITCTDSAKSRVEIGKILKGRYEWRDQDRPFYWMDFGNGQKSGQVVLGTITKIHQPESKFETTDQLPNVIQQFPEMKTIEEDDSPSCSIAQALGKQDLFINSTLAQLGCNLLWKLLTEPKITHRGVYLNLDNMTTNPIKI